MADADFVSDLNNLPDDVVPANVGTVETHRGSDDVNRQRADVPAKVTAPTPVTDDAPAKPLSLRDQISNALKGDDNTPAAAQLDGGQVRGPDGKFATKVVTDPVVDPAAPVGAVTYPQAGIPGLTPETFSKLPAETQQAVARTMEQINTQASRFAAYDQIERVIAPRRQAWAINGLGEGQVLNQLFALSDYAEKDPKGFVAYFAKQRGLDLEELAFGPDPVDAATTAQNERIQQLEAQIRGFSTQQQQAAHNGIVQEVIAFADEKGADGKHLRPYFAELGNSVLPFIQAEMQRNPGKPRAEILTAAYDTACWGNPTVRAKMQAAADAAREAERLKAETGAVGRARRAGVSVPAGSPGDTGTGSALSTGRGSLRDTIKASIAAQS